MLNDRDWLRLSAKKRRKLESLLKPKKLGLKRSRERKRKRRRVLLLRLRKHDWLNSRGRKKSVPDLKLKKRQNDWLSSSVKKKRKRLG